MPAFRLALVTLLQYVENLSDRQAANAVRERIDWKYALGLELTDPGFDFSLLSAFRTRLVNEQVEALLLDRLLEVCKQRGWLKAGGKQRTDSTHVLARVRSLSNLECVGETLRAVLDDLATLAPDWLAKQISPDWFERYSHRVENYRLPKQESQRTALAQQIGADGLHLLQALSRSDAPAGLKDEGSRQLLRQVWQQYYDQTSGKAKWRAGPQESSGEGIVRSICCLRTRSWIPVMSMRSCWSAGSLALGSDCSVPSCQTTVGRPKPTRALMPPTFRSIGREGSRPVRKGRQVSAGRPSTSQIASRSSLPGTPVQLARAARIVRSRRRPGGCCTCVHEPLIKRGLARRQEQQTQEFHQQYAKRAGIEGTLSQGVRGMGLRRARYDGLHKIHLQHVLTAVAINLVRIDAVLTQTPRGKTRRPPFARLASHPSLQGTACA